MKAGTAIGIVLIFLGIVGFAVGGVTFTQTKKDVDVRPVQISHNKTETVPTSPIFSTLAVVVGAGLLVVGLKSR